MTFRVKAQLVGVFLIITGLDSQADQSSVSTDRVHRYSVEIGAELKKARVKACFDGAAPEYLVVDYRKATRNLIKFPKADKGHIEFQGRYWQTESLGKDACLKYEVDISEHNRRNRRIGEDDPKLSFQTDNTWLWLPEAIGKDEEVEISFALPASYNISAPWDMLDQSGQRYLVGKMPHDWGFSMMMGDFELSPITLNNGARINIAMLKRLRNKEALKKWVRDMGNTLSEYLGFFPVNQLQVLLLENTRFKSGPVPWGEVKRGGGFGIGFVVNSQRPIKEFYADWTATHEFSHLLIPNLESTDGWLSEGLASYLQYVLMAQSGEISPELAWENLLAGFNRGLNGTKRLRGERLVETAERRRRGGRTMRYYWSGAVYFFTADVRLRQTTNGRVGLPEVLSQLNQCCIKSRYEWSGIRLAEKMDEISASSVFSELYNEFAYSKSFPEFEPIFQQLGMKISDDEVALQAEGDHEIRDSIMSANSSR